VERYLLVRDSDGAVLDTLDSKALLRMLTDRDRDESWLRGLSFVRIADHQGAIVGTTSITAVRRAGFAPPARLRRT
jgi:hypothetical protein